MTDADLIAAFSDRLLAGAFGERAFMLPIEETYLGMWTALVEQIPVWEQRFGFTHPVVFEVRSAVQRIADARPDAVRVFALATTRYGREDELREAA